MDQWIARKFLEHDRKLEAVSRGGIGIGNSSVTGGTLEIEGDHEIRLADGGINYIAGPPPPKPSAPTLQAGVGSVFVTWDGQWAEANDEDEAELDTEAPLDFDRIEVHCSTDPEEADWGEDTLQGEIKAKAGGTVMVRGGDVEDEVFVCLIGLSKTGERGEASDRASIIIEGIDIAAITSELDAANLDLTNLDGEMFAADAEIDAAKIALKNVDLAVISTEDGTLADALSDARDLAADLANQAKADAIADAAGKDATLKSQIDGDIGQARTDLEAGISSAESRAKAEAQTLSDAARDAANTFTSTRVFGPTQIADNAITTAKLAAESVEAGKIKAGAVGAVAIAADSIEGRHVKANAITTDKLLVGGDRNLVPNGDLSAGSALGWASAFTYQTTDTPPAFAAAVNITGKSSARPPGDKYTVEPGDTLIVEAWVKADKPNSRIVQEFRDQAGAHVRRSGYDWVALEGGSTTSVTYPVYMLVPTVWTKIVSRIIVPPNVTSVYLGSFVPNHLSGTERTATVSIAGLKLYRQVGATLIADGAITTDKILADAITAGKIAANAIGARAIAADAVEAGKIAANAITSREILANAITAEKIVGLAVTADKLAANSVSATKIAANAVVADKLAANAVTAGTIAALAVTADKIAANAITADKLAANAVTAGSIQAGAINGMKIVGPDIFTSETGNRVHLGAVGLESFDANNRRTFFADAATGNVSMTGSFYSNDPTMPRVEIDNDDWASIPVVDDTGATQYVNGAGIRIGSSATDGFSIYHGAWSREGGAIRGQSAVIEGPLGLGRFSLGDNGQTQMTTYDSSGYMSGAVFTDAGGGASLQAINTGVVTNQVVVKDYAFRASSYGANRSGSARSEITAYGQDYAEMRVISSGGSPRASVRTDSAGNVEIQSEEDVKMTINDGGGGRLRVPAVYNVTASGTANVVVNSSGTLFRPSSSRRYKREIEDFTPAPDILDVQTKTWRDIRAVADSEKAHDYLAEIGQGPLPPKLQDAELEPARHFGAIAEEVHDLGLTELVEYDAFGRPDALKYPMFGVALIPAIRDLRDRVTQLEEKLNG